MVQFLLKVFSARAAVVAAVTLAAAVYTAVTGNAVADPTVQALADVLSEFLVVLAAFSVAKLVGLVGPIMTALQRSTDGDPNT